MVLSVLLVIVTIIASFYYWLKNQNSDHWNKRNVPHVKKASPFGLTWDFIVSRKSLAELYKDIYKEFDNQPYIGIFLGSKPALLLRDPKNIQAVLSGDFKSFYSRGRHVNESDKLGNNILFTNDFCKWRLVRKKLSPVFSSYRLKNMFCVMEKAAKEFVGSVEANEDIRGNTCNLMHTYTDTMLTTSLFGVKSNNHHSPFRDVARGAVASSLKENMKFVIGNTFPSISRMLKFTAFGDFEDFFIRTVKNVIRNREKDNKKGYDFIDYTIHLQKQGTMKDTTTNFEIDPTDEFIAAQAFFFFIAGVDTAASALHFTLLELSCNLKILTKVHEEIDNVFNKCNDDLNFDNVNELKYLDMVVSETLRKYPPVGVVHRCCTKDTVLPVGDLKVKVGDRMIIPIYAVHNDPNNHPDPEKFDPERFAPKNIGKFNKSAYIPFGGGNRTCLGSRFGRLQVMVGLAWLLRRFTLKPQHCTSKKLDPSYFLVRMTKPRYGLIPRGNNNKCFV